MKNKQSVYLLIFAVIAVWGIIAYRIYAATTEEDVVPIKENQVSHSEYFKLKDHNLDHYTLSADYRDPFSGLDSVPHEKPLAKQIESVNTNLNYVMNKPQINWFDILYLGYIHNPQSKKRIGIFSLNGREAMLSEGEESFGLKIRRFIGDSVKVTYQNASKFISIKK